MTMIDTILQRIAGGEVVDPTSGELATALNDAAFRRDVVRQAIEFFDLHDRIDPSQDVVGQATASPEMMAGFLQSLSVFVGLRESFEAGLEPSAEAVPSTACHTPELSDVDQPGVERALELLARAFFVGSRFDRTVQIEGDLFVLPNYELADAQVHWTAAADDAGPVALAAERPTEIPSPDGIGSSGRLPSELLLAEEPGSEVLEAAGSCEVTLATRLTRLTFTRESVNSPTSHGEVTATLAKLDRDVVRVTIEGADPELPRLVMARDAAGQRLDERESQTQRGRTWTKDIRFAGMPAEVEVVLASELVRRTVDVVATSPPERAPDGPWRVARAPRYEPPRRALRFEDVSADQLNAFEVAPGRTTASFEFNQHELHVHLPRADNTALANVTWHAVAAVDRRDAILADEVHGCGSSRDLCCHRFAFSDDIDRLAVVRLRGRVAVEYPLRMQRSVLTPTSPMANGVTAEFEGPRARVWRTDTHDLPDDFSLSRMTQRDTEEARVIRAFDASGMELQRLPSQSWSGGRVELVFWGEPVRVEVWTVAEAGRAQRDFLVLPAPELDESLSGSDDRVDCRGWWHEQRDR